MSKSVGEIIKNQRVYRGMSKSELAKRLGCSPQNVDSLETRKSIDFEMAQRLSLILEFDLFDHYRVYKAAESEKEKAHAFELSELKVKYMDLLERHNHLLEKYVFQSNEIERLSSK